MIASTNSPSRTRTLLLLGRLAAMLPTPVVELNGAVAIAMAYGPEAGLEHVEALDDSGRLSGFHLLPATRADLLRHHGRHDEAATSYRAALELASTTEERDYLRHRLEECARMAGRSR